MTTFSFKNWTRFGTWNVRTLLDTSRLAQVCREFKRYNLLFMGLCETRWPGAGEFTISDGLSLIYSGKPADQPKQNGVGIILSKSAKDALIDWKPYSDRIITARFRTKARNLTCIHCYAPTEVTEIAAKEEFYALLTKVTASVNRGDIMLLTGDFNAQVGSINTGLEGVMGRHGLGRMTENGELFVETCFNNNMVIGGTLFPHKKIHKVTWISPDNITENQIDHIAISRKWRGSLLDVRNKRGADCGSDHHLLVGKIRLKIAAIKKIKNPQRKFNVEKLKNPRVMADYTRHLTESLERTPNNNWKTIKERFTDAAKEHIGYREEKRKPWISDRTWNIISERKRVKNILNCAKTRSEKSRIRSMYQDLDKQVKKSARQDKRKWANDLAQDAERAAGAHRTRDLYRITKKLTKTSFVPSNPLKNDDGELVTSKSGQVDIWTKHYTSILDVESQYISNPCNCEHHFVRTNIPDDCPNIPEIVDAINSLKCNKSPGIDNIAPELFKASPEISARLIYQLMDQTWATNTICDELKEGLIINIPKKGDLSQCKNWRGITLINTANKILAQIINKRLTVALDPLLRNEQAGFRPHRSCIDHINSLRIIVEQSVEWRSPLYLVFIDFEKAFDTLAHTAIWNSLVCKGVPTKIIDIIKALYDDAKCRVFHEGCISDPIAIRAGVRQGCVLSPLLFNIVLDNVMTRSSQQQRGITWGLNKRLEDLDYADDICLLSHNHSDMQDKIDAIQNEAAKTGLKINIRKTKVMRINGSNNRPFVINDQNLEEVSSFCYLGSILTTTGGSSDDIKNRIRSARNSFGNLNPIWRSPQISRRTKLSLFNSCIKSTLLYGCESWNAAQKDINSLQVFTNRCLRRILKIFWPVIISNEHLWAQTNQSPISIEILKRKWRWIGHTLRKPSEDINRQAIEWNPQGSRRKGRPSHTWRRQIEIEASRANKSWNEIKTTATNRSAWNEFVMALCSL